MVLAGGAVVAVMRGGGGPAEAVAGAGAVGAGSGAGRASGEGVLVLGESLGQEVRVVVAEDVAHVGVVCGAGGGVVDEGEDGGERGRWPGFGFGMAEVLLLVVDYDGGSGSGGSGVIRRSGRGRRSRIRRRAGGRPIRHGLRHLVEGVG